jgi:hypothetical protein
MSEASDENKSDMFIKRMNQLILPTDTDDSHIDTIATVDMAFIIGPVRDGIILNHGLSPIPIHPNPFSPLQNLNDDVIYRQCMQTFLTPVSSQNILSKVSYKNI